MSDSAAATHRGTSNRDQRGGTKDRRARRAWLLKAYESDTPGLARCYRCGTLLGDDNITVDRIVPGAKGGTYRRTNIRPCCARCNSETGGRVRG
jgi:5-methylcytosine-specific restriction endonuclease McrA